MEEETIKQEEIDDNYFDFDVIVENREFIKCTVRVTKGFDAKTGKSKMVVYRTELVNDNIEFITKLLNNSIENIERLSNDNENVDDNSKELTLEITRKLKFETEINNLNKILAQPYQEWTATFRYPGLAEKVAIESRSYTQDAFGEKSEYNEYEAIRAKIEILLVEWNVKNKGKIIPIKQAMKCDSDLLKAFIEDFDMQLNSYIFEERKK